MTRPLYQHIASTIDAYHRCKATGNTEWTEKYRDALQVLADLLPSGAGIDSGTAIDWEQSY